MWLASLLNGMRTGSDAMATSEGPGASRLNADPAFSGAAEMSVAVPPPLSAPVETKCCGVSTPADEALHCENVVVMVLPSPSTFVVFCGSQLCLSIYQTALAPPRGAAISIHAP